MERAKQVLAALRKLPAYKQIQATAAPGKPWDLAGKTQVVVMDPPSGKPLAFIFVDANEGCGDFQGDLSAVFELDGDTVKLGGKPMGAPPRMPVGLIDLGDGKLEILFSEGVLRGATGFDQLDTLVIPFLDCAC
ncbi:MAG: hypothetical protein H0T76_19845 [Nannocystis sp.]|nr:hypothetical protein [Nannocystis sp.]MBA3548741.1 hypothetical protein [Nannocystis sp.]